MYLTVKLICW